jgi:trans-AT polyketide synthase, acyltransferase and oxidoreductase domains
MNAEDACRIADWNSPLGGFEPLSSERSQGSHQPTLWWRGNAGFRSSELLSALQTIRKPLYLVRDELSQRFGVGLSGTIVDSAPRNGAVAHPLVAVLPAIRPEQLGEQSFCETHSLRFPYVAGEMANGIATTKMVVAMANAGMLGFFGAAGLPLTRINQAVDELEAALGTRKPWGINLIHSPNDPAHEERTVDLFIRREVIRVSASAFRAI